VTVDTTFWAGGEVEGSVSVWFFDNGAVVGERALLGEAMVGKSQAELLAPVAGRLKILVAPEQVFGPGAVLALIHAD
jgi:pyruvate/2-oxoglutarate dehydrogenase complex dihydrolipoamide acyltransferase (E2) component